MGYKRSRKKVHRTIMSAFFLVKKNCERTFCNPLITIQQLNMKKYKPIILKLHTEKEALAIIAALSNTTNNSLKEELKKEYKEEVEFDDEPYRLWEKLIEHLGFRVDDSCSHHFRDK